MKKVLTIALSALLIFSCLTGFLMQGTTAVDTSPSGESAAEATESSLTVSSSLTANVSGKDTNTSWDSTATFITLSGASATVSGSGAVVSGSTITITSEGTYVVSGTLSDGMIAIAAVNTDKIHLILNGVDITNKTGAPIYASQCDKLVITLAEGTENSLTDGGENFQYEDATNEEPNAALFCKDDLTINGTGSLTVSAGFNNGIVTKDDLLIVSGDITVTAANNAIRGNDSVTILDGNYNLTAGNDGIQTNNTDDTTLGWVLIEGGTITISSAQDGIQADTAISITGGEFSIVTGNVSSSDTASDSQKAIKSDGSISITGGSFDIESVDDAIHATVNIDIAGGEFTISTGDDGVHADGDLTVSAGSITVTKSYEGLEASNISITGGTIDLVCSDDAINAAGGADQSGFGGGFGGGGRDSFASSGAYSISISGGSISFMAGGDGFDSNGTITVSGGSIIALIDSTSDNTAFDSDGGTTFTGGTMIYGGTGTGSPGSNSTQSSVLISGVSAGNELTVQKDGITLITYTPTVSCQYLAFSSPDIISGESYEIYSGGTLLTTATAGAGGMMGGGMMGGRGR